MSLHKWGGEGRGSEREEGRGTQPSRQLAPLWFIAETSGTYVTGFGKIHLIAGCTNMKYEHATKLRAKIFFYENHIHHVFLCIVTY